MHDFTEQDHDHDSCIESALERAEEICDEQGLRLTALRRQVLKLVWHSHKPIGAYDILEVLSTDGRRAAPPTVYRALEFLISAGLVHRLESLNAFIGCPDPSRSHSGQFLICERCRAVVELEDDDLSELLDNKAAKQGFAVTQRMMEIQGICQACRKTANVA